MNQKIWKYKIYNGMVQQQIEMPIGAVILKIININKIGQNEIWLWAQINTKEKKKEYRTIELVGTGCIMQKLESDDLKRIYIDTIFQFGGSFVWHIFEIVYDEQLQHQPL